MSQSFSRLEPVYLSQALNISVLITPVKTQLYRESYNVQSSCFSDSGSQIVLWVFGGDRTTAYKCP